uniref:Uncharacterized protein n=1 Tax=viral metagenome TaxID=1070528 RepID=A0A6M3LIG1_9ZZZZ
MKEIPKTRTDKMGRLNNQVVELVDKSDLTPLEAIVVLRMVANRLEQLFDVSTRGGK